MAGWRYRGRIAAWRPLLLTMSTNCVIVSFLAQQPSVPSNASRTSARFSVDADLLQLQTAVAIAEDHDRSRNLPLVLFQFSGTQLRVEAKGATSCDLTSIGGRKRAMSWDVNVNVPVFTQK